MSRICYTVRPMPGILEGKKAPAFALEDADGRKVALMDFAGRDLVLWFYLADDTPD